MEPSASADRSLNESRLAGVKSDTPDTGPVEADEAALGTMR